MNIKEIVKKEMTIMFGKNEKKTEFKGNAFEKKCKNNIFRKVRRKLIEL